MSKQNKKSLMIIDNSDFAKRQFYGWRQQKATSFGGIDLIHIDCNSAKSFLKISALILKIYETLFFFIYRNNSLLYKYYFSKTSLLSRLIIQCLGRGVAKLIYNKMSVSLFPGSSFNVNELEDYDYIYLYVGAYSIEAHNICNYIKKKNKKIFYQCLGWDNLTSKVPLMAGVSYLAPCKHTLKHINSIIDPSLSEESQVFPMPNHDIFKNISSPLKKNGESGNPTRILVYFPVKKYPVNLLVNFLEKFKNMNYQVDYKIHPSLSFDNGLIRGVSSLVLENDGRFTLVSTANNCSQKKYENPIDLLADYDVIISPAGSILLEAAIQNKTCIALAFGGLRFNYYGDILIRAKHFSGLCHDYGLFVAYDFFQLHYFLENLKQLIEVKATKNAAPQIDYDLFEDRLINLLLE